MKVINGERFQNLCETQISKKEHKKLESNTDSIEIVLIASLAFCLGWGIYQIIIGLIGRFG